MRLQTRFVLAFSSMAVVPLALVGVLAYRSGRAAIEERLGQLFEQSAERGLEALDREASARQASAEGWARLELMQDALRDDLDGRITTFLLGQAREDKALLSALTLRDGRVLAASRPEWVGKAIESLPFRGLRPRHPLRRIHPRPPGLLGALLLAGGPGGIRSASRDRAAARALRPPGPGASPGAGSMPGATRVPCSSCGGTARSDRPSRERSGPWTRASPRRTGTALAPLSGQPNGLRGGDATPDASSWWDVRWALPTAGARSWSSDADVAFAPAARLRGAILGATLLVALAAVGLSVFLARRIGLPLLELRRAAERVASGQLDVQVVATTGDEVGSLTRSFGAMVAQLREQRARLVDRDFIDSILAHMADGLFVVDGSGTRPAHEPRPRQPGPPASRRSSSASSAGRALLPGRGRVAAAGPGAGPRRRAWFVTSSCSSGARPDRP